MREMNMVQLNIYQETEDKDNANKEIKMVQLNIKPERETRIMSTRIQKLYNIMIRETYTPKAAQLQYVTKTDKTETPL